MKIVHLFLKPDFKFIPFLVHSLNEISIHSISQLFVTPYEKTYDHISKEENVFLDKRKNYEIINDYSNKCDHLIIHGFQASSDILKIKKSHLSKIVWRSWGDDLFYYGNELSFLKRMMKKIRFHYVKKKISNFYAFAGDNVIDKENLIGKFCNKLFFDLPYKYNDFEFGLKNNNNNNRNNYRIMIGHSGDPRNNHIKVINTILESEVNFSEIVIPLAYFPGNPEYVENVKNYAKKKFNDKLLILDSFMEYNEYIKFLSMIDLAIFDSLDSYALGNIALLIKLGKTVVLNENGIMHKTFKKMGIPHYTLSDLSRKDIELLNSTTIQSFEKYFFRNKEEFVQCWVNLYNELSKNLEEKNETN